MHEFKFDTTYNTLIYFLYCDNVHVLNFIVRKRDKTPSTYASNTSLVWTIEKIPEHRYTNYINCPNCNQDYITIEHVRNVEQLMVLTNDLKTIEKYLNHIWQVNEAIG